MKREEKLPHKSGKSYHPHSALITFIAGLPHKYIESICIPNIWPDENGAELRKTGKEVPTIVFEFMLNFYKFILSIGFKR